MPILAQRGPFAVHIAAPLVEAPSAACAIQRSLELRLHGRDAASLAMPAHAARTCLADRPLYFIGDSTMRYQYMSLVYFLEWGRWPDRCTRSHGLANATPSVVKYVDFSSSWNAYFLATDSLFRGHMRCDCYDNPNLQPQHTTRSCFAKVENRYYTHRGLNARCVPAYMYMCMCLLSACACACACLVRVRVHVPA